MDTIDCLILEEFIVGKPFRWSLVDGASVLGVNLSCMYVGRDAVTEAARSHCRHLFHSNEPCDTRAPMMVFCGTPGSGKSRALLE